MTEKSTQSNLKPVNVEDLLSYCQGKKELALKLMESFEQVGPKYLQELVDAINTGDCDEMRSMCHKIRGAGAIIHAEKLLVVVAKIRQNAIDQEVEQAKSFIPELEKAFADITEHNVKYCASPG